MMRTSSCRRIFTTRWRTNRPSTAARRDRFDQLSEGEHREALRHYLAFCSYEDHLFGRVLEALEHSGQTEETVVVYLSDHGDYAAEHGLWAKGLPSFLPAYHIPAVVRLPESLREKNTAGSVSDAFVSLADFAPTLLDLAGLPPREDFAGASLLPLLRGETPSAWRDALFFQSNGNELYGIQRGLLTRDWKFTFNGFDYDELYDLRADPHETINLARQPEHRETCHQLMRRLWQFGFEHNELAICTYIMTGLADLGPISALEPGD